MVSQQRGLAMKRKMPLMINDASQLQPAAKIKKIDSLEDMPQNFSPVRAHRSQWSEVTCLTYWFIEIQYTLRTQLHH